jgi:hypothetical protein
MSTDDIFYDDLSKKLHNKIKEKLEENKNEEIEEKDNFIKMCDVSHQKMIEVLKEPEFLNGSVQFPFNDICNSFNEFKKCKSYVHFSDTMQKKDIKITQTSDDMNYVKLNDVSMRFKSSDGYIYFGYV